jgi:hypothetical protein
VVNDLIFPGRCSAQVIIDLYRYSRACVYSSVFLDRAQLLTQKLLKQAKAMLKSLLQKNLRSSSQLIWLTVERDVDYWKNEVITLIVEFYF